MCCLSHLKKINRHEPNKGTASATAKKGGAPQRTKLGEGGQGGLMAKRGGGTPAEERGLQLPPDQ